MIAALNALSLFTLLLSWWGVKANFGRLPASIPIHFDILGQVDRWGSKRWLLLLLLVQTATFALHFLLSNNLLKPTKPLSASAALPIHVLMLEVQLLFAYLLWRMCAVALGRAKGLGLAAFGGLLAVILATAGWLIVVASRAQG